MRACVYMEPSWIIVPIVLKLALIPSQVQVSGDECIHLRILQNLKQTISLDSFQQGKTIDEPITYF